MFTEPLPRNGRCLQSHRLATGLYTTILKWIWNKYVVRITKFIFRSMYVWTQICESGISYAPTIETYHVLFWEFGNVCLFKKKSLWRRAGLSAMRQSHDCVSLFAPGRITCAEELSSRRSCSRKQTQAPKAVTGTWFQRQLYSVTT
jgi:hypothetical protein